MPRHPLDPDDPVTSIFTVRLPAKVAERIRGDARRAGESLSDHVRSLLDGAGTKTAAAAKAKPPSSRESEALRHENERLRKELAEARKPVPDGAELIAARREIERLRKALEEARKSQQDDAEEEDLGPLPKTWQQKFDIYKRRLDKEYAFRVDAEAKKQGTRWLDEMALPLWKEYIEEAERLFKRRKGIMTNAEYNKILFSLSPDHKLTYEARSEAYRIWLEKPKALFVPEKEHPTDPNIPPLPSTVAEWQAKRAAKRAENSARAKAAWAKRKK